MKKILVFNQGHTENLGDIAIDKTLEKSLTDLGFDVAFIPLWSADMVCSYINKCSIVKHLLHVFPFVTDILYEKYLKNHCSMNGVDAIIVGGGELIGGHYGFNSALNVLSKIAKRNNIKIFLYGVSGSKNRLKKIYQTRNLKSFSRLNRVFVRDSVSYELVTNVYKYTNVVVYPDVVYSYRIVFDDYRLCSCSNGILVVPISFIKQLSDGMGFIDKDAYCDYLLDLIQNNCYTNDCITITSSCSDDDEFCEYFYKYLNKFYSDRDIRIIPYSSLKSYIDLLLENRIVISGRMHAMILALIFGCEVIPIPFKDKIKCFKETIVDCYSDEICNLSFGGIKELANSINCD